MGMGMGLLDAEFRITVLAAFSLALPATLSLLLSLGI